MTPFHSGQKASGGGQRWPQAKPQCPDVKRETACCLCTALLTASSFAAVRAIIGQGRYIHLWQIETEGGTVDTMTAIVRWSHVETSVDFESCVTDQFSAGLLGQIRLAVD